MDDECHLYIDFRHLVEDVIRHPTVKFYAIRNVIRHPRGTENSKNDIRHPKIHG